MTATSRQPSITGGATVQVAAEQGTALAAPTARRPVAARHLFGLFGTGSLAGHRQRYGPVPELPGPALIELIDRANLRGRGGAGFPTAVKMRAVVSGGREPVVVGNGCEGEPASEKDGTLLSQAPHLVLDGAVLAARAVGARRVVICIHRRSPCLSELDAAIAERTDDPVGFEIALVPRRYVASEESALMHYLNSGDARPIAVPPRPFQRGLDGRPTLVDNVETLAHVATIAAWGPAWFWEAGSTTDPGSTLVTIGGAVARPGVYEIALGSALRDVLDLAGPQPGAPAALIGGYFGEWLPLPAADSLPVTHDAQGATVGAGAILALPREACGLAETARAFGYLAAESAGQCGPCQFGLPAVAEQMHALAASRLDQSGYRHLIHRLGVIPGRGACRHPDGAIRLAASALQVFADDVRLHLNGHVCVGHRHPPVLPVPHPNELDRDWQ